MNEFVVLPNIWNDSIICFPKNKDIITQNADTSKDHLKGDVDKGNSNLSLFAPLFPGSVLLSQKLMFVDILGRIQQWTSLVEKKLEDCKKALELMRKELMARLCEIENLKKQLADCKTEHNTERDVNYSVQIV